jgi:hypothetical protein
MGRAWLFSSLMHTALAVLLYFGLPSFTRAPPGIEQFVTVELVSEPPQAEPEAPEPAPAATAPEPPRVAAAPEPPPPPEPVAEPEPGPEPAPPPEPDPEIAQPAEPEPAPPPPEPEPEPAPPPEPEPELAQPPEPEPAPEPEPEPQRAAPRPSLKPPPRQLAEATPEPEPETPEPPKPTPAMAPRTEPEPEKPPEPPKEDAFAALLRSVEEMPRREQAATEQAGTGRIPEGNGQAQSLLGEGRLTMSELDALRRQIYGCWAVPVGAIGLEEIVVQLRIQVGPDRSVRQVTIQDQARVERDATFRTVAESARRAVERCSPLHLPADKYAQWRDIMMSFSPKDAVNG